MAVVFVVTGKAQFDEETLHWNARAFTTREAAFDYIPELEERVQQFAPKLQDFLCTIRTDGNRSQNWEECSRLREKAEKRFRSAVGDQGFVAWMNPTDAEYTVESMEVF